MSEVELTPIRRGHEFDVNRVDQYMQEHVSDYRGPFTVQQFEGGQSNPTFLLETASRRYVMRKQPPGELLPSAHAVDREYRVMAALQETDVPVPEMLALCEDTNVIGTKFYIMSMVEGRLYTKTALPNLPKAERRDVYQDMARILACLHKVDPIAVGLESFGRPGNYFARQVSRWSRQYQASETETIDAMNRLIEWLPAHLPAETPPVIVHGDFRLGNVLLDESEPKVVAVLDWELSTLGDGLADLGYWCLEYYGERSEKPGGIAGADLDSIGIPNERDVIQSYCRFCGRDEIENWIFYVIYNLFRSAGIIQGVYKRGLDGNASSEMALEYEGVARKRSELAWQLVEDYATN